MHYYTDGTTTINPSVKLVDKNHRAILGDIRFQISHDLTIYLTRIEAYAVLNAMEAIIHELATEDCPHLEMRETFGGSNCVACGYWVENDNAPLV